MSLLTGDEDFTEDEYSDMEEELGTPRRSAGVRRRRVLGEREGGEEEQEPALHTQQSTRVLPQRDAEPHRLRPVGEEVASTPASGLKVRSREPSVVSYPSQKWRE